VLSINRLDVSCVLIASLAVLIIPADGADWNFREIIVADIPSHPAFITDCTVVDINGDGGPDLWYSSRKGTRKDKDHFVPWYENTGDMSKWMRHLPFTGPACYGTWGDIDGDGRLDVAVSSEEGADGVVWYRNPGGASTGAWKQNVVVPRNSGWEGMHTLQLADFDRDGDLDVLTAEMHNRGKARVAVCENADGRGGLLGDSRHFKGRHSQRQSGGPRWRWRYRHCRQELQR